MADELEKVVQVWECKTLADVFHHRTRTSSTRDTRVRTFTAIFPIAEHVKLTGEVHAKRLAPCLEAMYCNVIPIVAGECLYFVF